MALSVIFKATRAICTRTSRSANECDRFSLAPIHYKIATVRPWPWYMMRFDFTRSTLQLPQSRVFSEPASILWSIFASTVFLARLWYFEYRLPNEESSNTFAIESTISKESLSFEKKGSSILKKLSNRSQRFECTFLHDT